MGTAKQRRRYVVTICLAGGIILPALSQAVAQPRRVGSTQELLRLLKQHATQRFQFTALPLAATAEKSSDAAAGSVPAHSETNTQVAGVDEADTVKVSDDGHIFQIRDSEVRIIRGYPLGRLGLEATLRFADGNFHPTGLLVAGQRLVVLGSTWEALPATAKRLAAGIRGGFSHTRAYVYKLADPARPALERELSIEGDYLDTRRIGQAVYLLSRSYPRYYLYAPAARDTAAAQTASQLLPATRDSARAGGKAATVKLANVYYFPEFVEPDYAVVAGFRLDRPREPADIKAYLGTGEVVYASPRNLYLSASRYPFIALGRQLLAASDTAPQTPEETTRLYKFAIADGKSRFLSAGEVPGRVLNQFSMDEAGDYFRIATTLHDWASGQDRQRNGVYVLDRNLGTVGRLENLAPGEQIYSARFMGQRCYLVTFRTTDPLFAIDLAVPEAPKVLGELKLPGYSNYLHPYDDTHLVGFGKAALEVAGNAGNADQFWRGVSAYYQGMKLSLFDVSDVARPKELHSVEIGDRGTDSELLWNHKALYQNPERHLYGFPIQVARYPETLVAPKPWEYGQPVFQGAYVYEVTLAGGFTRKAEVSHIPPGQPADWSNSNLFIDRLVSIESGLYSLSPGLLKVNDLDGFGELAELPLGAAEAGGTSATPVGKAP